MPYETDMPLMFRINHLICLNKTPDSVEPQIKPTLQEPVHTGYTFLSTIELIIQYVWSVNVSISSIVLQPNPL